MSLKGIEVVVPGSVANLGAGFDTLGVAVQLYLRVRIVDVQDNGEARLVVARSTPPVQGGNALERAFAVAAMRTKRPAPSVWVEVESDIPMAAGLGSSAAASVAGLRVFERVTRPLTDDELLALATEVEGHADNAAPALFGGLTSVIADEQHHPTALRWTWPDDLRLVVVTPAMKLATAKARAALPEMLSRRDAIFNMQRALSFVHALETRDYDRLREAVRDRWHQGARASMVPVLREALALQDPDVLGAFLSGAGPSIAFLARRNLDRLEHVLSDLYGRAGVSAVVRTLSVHHAPVLAATAASSVGRTA